MAALLDGAGTRLEAGELLDVGCGAGWLLDALAQRDAPPGRLHGVDLLPERVAAAQARVPQADIRQADARRLPFEDERFDVVTLLVVLSSMPERRWRTEALTEAARVLRAGGALLCYEPVLPNPFNRATSRVSAGELRTALGAPTWTCRLTALPPLTRHLGPATRRLYPFLSRAAPTHRLTVHEGAAARRRGG